GARCRARAATRPRARRAPARARRRGGRREWPSACSSRRRSTRRSRRSPEESRLHEGALRVVEALERLAPVLVLEGPARLERVLGAQLGLARVAGSEDVGPGGDRRVTGKLRRAIGGAAKAQEEVALGLLALAEGPWVGVEWKPFFLAPVFKNHGWNDSPFNRYPAKGRYMWRDLERLCAKYGLPFRRPSVFPRSSLLAARVARTAAAEPWCGD